ncbi:MAG: hypothetical protein M0P69_12035 [Bacteroidales bacterium]|jgi:hypothetical protein|nr:hypothetical protein [Bacteroidales bacterium]
MTKRKAFLFIVVVLVTLFAVNVFARGLSSSASYIKSNYPTEYKNTIRAFAVNKWKDNYNMVVYEISRQSDSLVELVSEFKSENTNVARRAIGKWSIKGYAVDNARKFKDIKTFDVESLIQLYCNWSMVKYEYERQVGAKNSF